MSIMQRFWSSGETQKITSVTRRQLEYWVNTRLIRPSASKLGTRQWWFFTFDDLVRIRTVVDLREKGGSLQHIRSALRALHGLSADPLRECRLLVFGKAVHVIEPEIETEDLVVKRVLDGQLAYKEVILEDLAHELEDKIVEHPDLGREDIVTRGLVAGEVERSA